MRLIFIFFLLANVGYFYLNGEGFRDRPASMVVEQPPLPAGVKRLTQLQERGLGVITAEVMTLERLPADSGETAALVARKQPMSTEASPRVQGVESLARQVSREMVCFTLGPFQQTGAAGRAAEAISALDVIVKRRQVSQRKLRGYRVYLPPLKNYAAVSKKVQEMQKKGLKDLFIMGKGLHKNAISLGLFNRKRAAEKRLKQVKVLGFQAQLEPRYRVSEQAWLDLSVPASQTTTVADVTALSKTFSKASLSRAACELTP
jgi:hypothetical protein